MLGIRQEEGRWASLIDVRLCLRLLAVGFTWLLCVRPAGGGSQPPLCQSNMAISQPSQYLDHADMLIICNNTQQWKRKASESEALQ